jgi:hypothetical protein
MVSTSTLLVASALRSSRSRYAGTSTLTIFR